MTDGYLKGLRNFFVRTQTRACSLGRVTGIEAKGEKRKKKVKNGEEKLDRPRLSRRSWTDVWRANAC